MRRLTNLNYHHNAWLVAGQIWSRNSVDLQWYTIDPAWWALVYRPDLLWAFTDRSDR